MNNTTNTTTKSEVARAIDRVIAEMPARPAAATIRFRDARTRVALLTHTTPRFSVRLIPTAEKLARPEIP